jgi:hypothetical protein
MVERGIIMINNISEGVLRSTSKVDPNHVIHEKETNHQKLEQVKENRPVENSESSAKSESREARDKKSYKFVQVENHMVFEKYNSNGDVVLRIPPSSKPINEMA